jgi:hypothetical protein
MTCVSTFEWRVSWSSSSSRGGVNCMWRLEIRHILTEIITLTPNIIWTPHWIPNKYYYINPPDQLNPVHYWKGETPLVNLNISGAIQFQEKTNENNLNRISSLRVQIAPIGALFWFMITCMITFFMHVYMYCPQIINLTPIGHCKLGCLFVCCQLFFFHIWLIWNTINIIKF